MELRKYLKQTKQLDVTLTAGEVLKLEYRPNFMTGDNLSLIDSARGKAQEDGSFVGMHGLYVEQLTLMLDGVDVTDDGKKVPFESDQEKTELLKQFSFQDLEAIDLAIRKDIEAPLVSTGTAS